MKRKNLTRNALVTSIISLLLCVSMLVGTTFAWFTDEVVTGMNTIAAGNLDVELLAGGTKVEAATKLFDDVALWEPGVVVYENLQVANVGTLALKYQMTMNFGNENDLNGHKLSEVLKVAVIDKIAAGATRQQVLEAAKASEKLGTLSNFYLTGALEAGASSTEQTVVIFWEPNDNATDNLYNANNGQKTSDGQALHIDFGVTLKATQQMSEEDSFGNDYDKFASILPKAKVTMHGPSTVTATTSFPNGNDPTDYAVPFIAQFEPNETLEDAKASAYKYWHADFVVKADRDVKAGSMALAGYYKMFCDNYNNKNWVMLTAGEDIPAGTEIRLVDVMGGGNGSGNGAIKVTYKDICEYGNDGTGFQCTAMDPTGANAGTTITVELRLYANESDPSDSSYNGGTETGEYYVIDRTTYTFKNEVSTAADLQAELAAGNDVTLAADIDLADDEVLNITGNTVIDLNNHTISGKSTTSTTSYMIKVASGAELTLSGNGTVSFYATTPDTEWGGEGQPPYPGYANNAIRCEGKLIIDGVTVENLTAHGGASYAIDCYQGSDLVVNSGVINGHGKCAIRMFCNSNTLSTNVTVNGGTITGKRAIWVQLPGSNIANVRPVNLTINGGELICTNTDADVCVYSYSFGDSFDNTNITITGGEFFGDVCFGGGNAKDTQENVSVTGGTFNGALGRYLANDGWEDIAKP